MVRCPGQDMRNLTVSYHPCPGCHKPVEFFSDELRVRCPQCKSWVYVDQTPTCIQWCKAARDCLGPEMYDRLMGKDTHEEGAEMADKNIENVLGRLQYNVAVVTVGTGGAENGLTVSWLSQVSFDPPMVMIAVDRGHYSNLPLESGGGFVVNLLSEDQKHLAGQFARQSMEGESKLEGLATREAESGVPILTEALGYLDCEVAQTVEAGDHTLFIGKVIGAEILNEGSPMTSSSGMRYQKA